MAFFVGQKVVKARSFPDLSRPFAEGEQKILFGQVLTIREIVDAVFAGDVIATALRFVEIQNPIRRYRNVRGIELVEMSYLAACFEPVTDISDLQSIVTEVTNGKPRKIEDDQFDAPRKKVRAR